METLNRNRYNVNDLSSMQRFDPFGDPHVVWVESEFFFKP